MKVKLGRRWVLPAVGILALLLAAGCAAGSPAAEPAPVLDSGPGMAMAQATTGGGMTPAVDQELLAEFAASQEAINGDWDTFHADFDAWRAGLTACDRSAMAAALREFAGEFGGVTALARDLPASGITRGLAYPVLDAAAVEGMLLGEYRDNWQPGNTALAAAVQTQRDAAAVVLRDTAERLDELGERDDPEQRAAAESLKDALEPISTAWDEVHQDYAALSREQGEIAPVEEVIDSVGDLLNRLNGEVLEPLQKLEAEDDAVAEVADDLAAAAKSERAAMGELLDGITLRSQEREAAAAEGPPVGLEELLGLAPETGEDDTGSDAAPEGAGNGEPPPPPPLEPVDNGDLFAVMNAEVDAANAARKSGNRELKKLAEGIKESDRQALAEFGAALNQLQGEWEDFHADYDDWVSVEGGCDRAAAAQALAEFQQRFNLLGARVRGMSQVSYLRPTADLLTAAVSGEEAALRALTSSWQPYAADIYRPLDRERAKADDLRRQADRRTLEAMERFGEG